MFFSYLILYMGHYKAYLLKKNTKKYKQLLVSRSSEVRMRGGAEENPIPAMVLNAIQRMEAGATYLYLIPTSLASIMVIGPHHAAVTHVGGSSEVGQREHMVRQGFTRKCWSEFLCLGGYLAPPRKVRGFVPRDALGRHPSADPRR
jgi:hypothetical protein